MLGNPPTFSDLRRIVSAGVSESLNLEFKSSEVLEKSQTTTVSKALSAFANSIGGWIVFGIDAEDGTASNLGSGTTRSYKEWLDGIVRTHIVPKLLTYCIHEIRTSEGTYYHAVNILPSPLAPHQSKDGKFYKRHGSSSYPMEAYEIDDVRNRPKEALQPLRLSIVPRNSMAFLSITNATDTAIRDITVQIESTFEFERDAINRLTSSGIKLLHPRSSRQFLLDSFYGLTKDGEEQELIITSNYRFNNALPSEIIEFNPIEYSESAVIRSDVAAEIAQLTDQVKLLNTTNTSIFRVIDKFRRIVDGTGLRLSARTLSELSRTPYTMSPDEMDVEGFKIILGISWDEAIKLHRVFGTVGGPRKAEYEALPETLRDKFESRFKPEF